MQYFSFIVFAAQYKISEFQIKFIGAVSTEHGRFQVTQHGRFQVKYDVIDEMPSFEFEYDAIVRMPSSEFARIYRNLSIIGDKGNSICLIETFVMM